MPDKYRNFAHLKRHEQEGVDFRIICRPGARADTVVVAPHGGGIEPGTSELAGAIANWDYGLYCFEGLKSSGNFDFLHITSTNFDEPRLLRLLENGLYVVAIHGCSGKSRDIFLGGRDEALKEQIEEALKSAGFSTSSNFPDHLSGENIRNICNRGKTGKGVQLEVSKALRQEMFEDWRSRVGRNSTTDLFSDFVEAMKSVLQELAPP